MLLLLLHKCFKRCIWAISVVLLLSDFKISWKAGKSQSEFQKNEWNAQFLSRKQFCKIFVLIRCLIRTDKMKCLRSISDIKTQIYGAKVVCMLLGYLFCFKVTDEIKHSINLPLITLHVGQWNLARGRHDHSVWPTFDREQRFFWFKNQFSHWICVESSSRLLIISRVRHVLYGDSPLIRNKGYWFWNQISLWSVSSALRLLMTSLWYRSKVC